MRFKFANAEEEALFMKTDGRGFTDIGCRITSFWRKDGIRPDSDQDP